jgi:hypothetical protein
MPAQTTLTGSRRTSSVEVTGVAPMRREKLGPLTSTAGERFSAPVTRMAKKRLGFPLGSGGFADEPDHPRRTTAWQRSEPDAGSRLSKAQAVKLPHASGPCRDARERNGITPFMSRRGNCLDNAPVDAFLASLKKEPSGARRARRARCWSSSRAAVRWSVQEIRRLGGRFVQRRIAPAFVIAWSVWQRCQQARAPQAHLKHALQLPC